MLLLCPVAVLRCAGVELFGLSIIKDVCTYVLVVGGLGAWRLHDVMWWWGVTAMLRLVFTIDFIYIFHMHYTLEMKCPLFLQAS